MAQPKNDHHDAKREGPSPYARVDDVLRSLQSPGVEELCDEAADAAGRGHTDRALKIYAEVLSQDPLNTTARFGRACVRALAGDGVSALEDVGCNVRQVEKYLGVTGRRDDPCQVANVYHQLAYVLMQCEKYVDAAKAYARAIEFDPGDSELWAGRAWAHFLSGNTQQALDDATTAARKAGDANIEVVASVARLYLESGDVDRASDYIERMLHRASPDSAFLEAIVLRLRDRADWAKALKLTEGASKLGADPSLRVLRAHLLASTGDLDGGIQLVRGFDFATHSRNWYNAACVYGVCAKNRPPAADWVSSGIDCLDRAVAAGWDDAKSLLEDEDLEIFRNSASFAAVLAKCSSRQK